MTKKFKVFSNESLTNLFSIFVIGTIGFFAWSYLYFKEILPWKSKLMVIIFLLSTFPYLTVLYSIIVYYFSRWGLFLFNKMDKNRERFVLGFEIFLGIIYLIGTLFFYKSIWVMLINLPIVLLMIGAMYPTNGWIKEFYKRKFKKNAKTKNKIQAN